MILDSCFTSDGRPYGGREFDWRDAFIPPAQIEWLRAELGRATQPVIAILHHRLDVDTDYGVRNRAEVRRVLEESGRVVAVLQGHNHVNALTRMGGIAYATLRSMVDGPGPESSAYGLLELHAGGGLFLRGWRLLESRPLGPV